MVHIISNEFFTIDPHDEDEFEDDFDLDSEFEDLDDDWNDEDSFEDLDSNITGTETDISDSTASPVAQKTFLQKFFLPIVIVVVLIFGGIFVAGQGLLNTSEDSGSDLPGQAQDIDDLPDPYMAENESDHATQITANDVSNSNKADYPDNGNNVTATNPADIPDFSSDTPLTPLIGEGNPSEPQDILELEDLDLALQNDQSSPEPVNVNNDDTSLEAFDELDQSLPDSVADKVIDFDTEASDQTKDIRALKNDNKSDQPSFSNTNKNVVPEMPMQDDDMVVEKDDNLISNIDALKAEQETLSQKNVELTELITEKTDTLETLTKQLNDAEKALKETKNALAAQKPKPSQKPKAARSSQTTSSPKPQKAIEWVLKAAYPGKAVLSAKGASDLKQIEIGDNVQNLGTITSIAQENGKWVVRGTKSAIFQ